MPGRVGNLESKVDVAARMRASRYEVFYEHKSYEPPQK